MKQQQPAKGRLLVSDPSILIDSVFSRSVILLAEHNLKGSVGFILNKPLDITLQDIVPEAPSNLRVYNGGPVEQDNLYFIHTVPDLIPNSLEIAQGVFWGGDFETLFNLLKDRQIPSNSIRFFLGYSGWDFEQLQNELNEKAWLCIENNFKNLILEKTHSVMWKELLAQLGDEFLIWINAPENPVMN